MWSKLSLAALLLEGLTVSATWTAYEEYKDSLPKFLPDYFFPSPRPPVTFSPKQPNKAFPPSPPRYKTCYVPSHNDFKTDDSPAILEALKECNNGGTVVFPLGETYVIGTAMDLQFLEHVDIDIQAYIQFTNDTTYWMEHAFYQTFQNATTFFELGGNDVNVYGGGMLDGNGQIWYDLYAVNDLILRPVLFGTIGLHTGAISNLRLRYSPQYYNFVANSTEVVFQGISIGGYSQNNITAKNTDGWDTYRSSDITIQNCIINNGDDCVSFKPNSTNILVQNLHCNGSHGISVGSLGQYVGTVDIVENVYVYNISLSNVTDGARIKVWPGAPGNTESGDLSGGGGTGSVYNITYDHLTVANADYGIEITQCYGQKNTTLCDEHPSSVTIEDVLIKDVVGTSSTKYEPISGYVVCSSETVCKNIQLQDIDIVAPDGVKNLFTCGNVDGVVLEGITCTTTNEGYN